MAPDDVGELRRWIERIENEVREWVARGREAWSTMLAKQGDIEHRILELPTRLDDRYLLRREAEERRAETASRLQSLELQGQRCMPRHEADDQHRVLVGNLQALRKQIDTFQHDHTQIHDRFIEAHQKVHDRADDEHTRLLYFILGNSTAIVFMLANSLLHIIPDGH